MNFNLLLDYKYNLKDNTVYSAVVWIIEIALNRTNESYLERNKSKRKKTDFFGFTIIIGLQP